MRALVFLILRLTALPFLLRELTQRRRVSILCYHDPRPEEFERHLRTLRRRYNVIPLKRYLEWRRDPSVALPPRSLVLTFDDGHRGNYLLANVLARYKVPITVFICSAIVGTARHFWWKEVSLAEHKKLKSVPDGERLRVAANTGFGELKEYTGRQALSVEEIEEMRGMVDFQSHSRFHPILPNCTDTRALEEIRDSKTELEQRFGLSIYAFAYPNGDYGERDTQLARLAGYQCALTIDGGYNDAKTDIFRLTRIRMPDAASGSEIVVKASGLWHFWEKLTDSRRRFLSRRHLSTDGTANVEISQPEMESSRAPGVPLVSVVISTHNREQLLKRAIRSAMQQTYPRLEIIVIDDGSSDETRLTVQTFRDPRIRYIRHDKSKGGAAARNTGIRAATGEYIAFLDDDDQWEVEKISEQLRLAERYKVVLCGYHGEERGRASRFQARPTVDLSELQQGFLRGGGTSALMVEAALMRNTLFDETLPRCQDWDVCIRLAQQGQIGYVARPLVQYNDGDHARISNKIRNMSPEVMERELIMVKKHKDFFGPRIYRYHMSRFLLGYVRHRPNRISHLLYVCRRYGVSGALRALVERLYLKASHSFVVPHEKQSS